MGIISRLFRIVTFIPRSLIRAIIPRRRHRL